MAPKVRPVMLSGAKGIDQSENPAPGTVWDACNVSTNRGVWELKPGYNAYDADNLDHPAAESPVFCTAMHEFFCDNRSAYASSDKILLSLSEFSGSVHTQSFREMVGTHEIAAPIYNFGTAITSKDRQFNCVNMLTRVDVDIEMTLNKTSTNYKNVSGTHRYERATLFFNGIDIPKAYVQFNPYRDVTALSYASGIVVDLISKDGGDSSTSYLAETPKGLTCEVFKERLFTSVGRTLYWTGPEVSSGAFIANCWPSSYNLDVGKRGIITALRVFKEQLIIFTEDEIYSLTGDGVSGNWNINLIDGSQGCLSQHGVCDIGNALLFVNRNGIFSWAGGLSQRISHPRLRETWKMAAEQLDQFVCPPAALFDNKRNRAIFTFSNVAEYLGTTTQYGTLQLVYNLENDSWDRWGAFGDLSSKYSAILERPAEVSMRSAIYNGEIVGVQMAGPRLSVMGENIKCANSGSGPTYSRAGWFIETNDIELGDGAHNMVVREVYLDSEVEGNFSILATVLPDGRSLRESWLSGLDTLSIIDSANSATHRVLKRGSFSDGETVSLVSLSYGYSIGQYTLTSIGTGSPSAAVAVTFDSGTDFATSAAHGLINGDTIGLSNAGGALPTGLSAANNYYVVNKTTDTFQLSLSLGGSPVDFTTNGTGTSYFFKIVLATFGSTINASAYGSTTFGVGNIVAFKDGCFPAKTIPMFVDETKVFASSRTGMYANYNQEWYRLARCRRMTQGVNCTGKSFALYLSNIGPDSVPSYQSANFKISAIGLGIISSTALRSDDEA